MKILTIPDIHGKTLWKTVFNPSFDLILFLGDYVDCFTTPDSVIEENLLNIVSLKKQYPDKVKLLWGNHEMHYLFPVSYYRCSGYRSSMIQSLNPILTHNKSLFQLAFQHENYLWSHAGVHRGWWNYAFKGDSNQNIADQLNEAFNNHDPYVQNSKTDRLFDCGWDRGGTEKVGGPLWIDRNSMWEKGLSGIHQIVGHSKVDRIMTCKTKNEGSVSFCDCLDAIEDYKIIEI